MKNLDQEVLLHPHFFEVLFAFKSKISSVFRDVLGIHEIDHIALTRISPNKNLLVLSSAPALEYNLFNSPLWRYDKVYQPAWYLLQQHASWQELYTNHRFDELYYLKQIKHAYPIGMHFAEQNENHHFIYSLASHKSCAHTQDLFANKQDDFYKIGQYCSTRMPIQT